jgi:dTMP kinase
VHEVILPALKRGAIVLCDRFVESTLAYQGGGRGLPIEQLRDVQRLATRGVSPDMRILLDIDVGMGIRRRLDDSGSSNRLDEENLAFHERVRAAYLAMVGEYPEGWSVIDADRSMDVIAREVWSVVQNMHLAIGRQSSC